MTHTVRFIHDGDGGYAGLCSQHRGWVYRTDRLTREALDKAAKSLKGHVTRNTSVVFEFIGCLPEEY